MTMVWITALGVGCATMVGALLGMVFRKTTHKFNDLVLSFAAATAGGIIRDLLLGVIPASVVDWRYLAVAMAAGVLAPLLRPIGLGDWKICVARISGFMAKESVVSTLEVLFGGAVATAISPLSAAAILVFSLLYTPCVAAIASVKRELGGGWALGVALWQCAVAWIAALAVRLIGLAFGMV